MENDTFVVEPTIHPLCFMVEDYYIVLRFWLNVVLGVTLSLICIVFNSFVFTVFVTNAQHRDHRFRRKSYSSRKSYNLYLLLLAMFDVFMGISYIAVLSNRVLINWTASYTLKSIWVKYMVPMLTVSHVAITASAYLITFAAIERYCISTDNWAVQPLQKHRKIFAFVAVMCGVISKGTILEEIEIEIDTDCIGTINEWQVKPSHLVLNHELFNKIWRFYFRNIFTVLAPFVVLLYLNSRLIYRLIQQRRIARNLAHIEEKQSVKQKKARILAVTRTLVVIVCTYLMSNTLSVVIAMWEYIDATSLRDNYTTFYVLSVDWISLFTIVASCLRLPIYAICQPILRKEMQNFVSQMWTKEKMTRRMTLIESLQMSLPRTLLLQQLNGDTADTIEFV